MRMTKNIWKPDTCGCILEFEFDADEPAGTRVHTPTECKRACLHHPNDEGHVKHYEKVLKENQLKNRALEDVKTQVDPSVKDKVEWSFDEDRNVVITLPASEKDKGIKAKEAGVIIQ